MSNDNDNNKNNIPNTINVVGHDRNIIVATKIKCDDLGETYYATIDGNIWNKNGGIRNQNVSNGYKTVSLKNKHNKQTPFQVHRLIALTFIVNDQNKPNVNHKNGIKTDNRAENLEWNTQKENIQHALITGLIKTHARKIIKLDLQGNVIARYKSLKDAVKTLVLDGNVINLGDEDENYNKYRHGINKTCKGINPTAHGFKWKYVEEKDTVEFVTVNNNLVNKQDHSEIFVNIQDCDKYMISNKGRVYSKHHKIIMNIEYNGNEMGYINPIVNGEKKTLYIGQLVAQAFIPNPNNYTKTKHINSNIQGKHDNAVNNLMWHY